MMDGRRDEGRKNEWMEGWVDRISKKKNRMAHMHSHKKYKLHVLY